MEKGKQGERRKSEMNKRKEAEREKGRKEEREITCMCVREREKN